MNYVAGFVFDYNLERVVLIRKERPEWQQGKYNGVGGKIEPGEYPAQAMAREFEEETGVNIPPCNWTPFGKITGTRDDKEVNLFTAVLRDVDMCKTVTDEQVSVYYVKHLPSNRIDNIAWTMLAAIDKLRGGKFYLNIRYGVE